MWGPGLSARRLVSVIDLKSKGHIVIEGFGCYKSGGGGDWLPWSS